MKLKLDENVDLRVVTFLRLAGHDVETVPNQGLTSAPDVELINVCRLADLAIGCGLIHLSMRGLL